MTPMRRHQMILEVEFFVNDEEDVEALANDLVERIFDEIKPSSKSGTSVADARLVSFDKEPLPQTEEDLADDKAAAEEEAARVVEIDTFLKRTALESPVGIRHLDGSEFFGTLQDVSDFHVSVLTAQAILMTFPREAIDEMWDDVEEEDAEPSN